MTQKIIAFSGKKQSGKNTACNFMIGMELVATGIVGSFAIEADGRLHISDIWGDDKHDGILDLTNPDPDAQKFLQDAVYPHVKLYSFADLLKKNVCMDIFGLSYAQCYGSDADKETLTDLMWEDMPGIVTDRKDLEIEAPVHGRLGKYYDTLKIGVAYHPPGRMTAREVLQYVGTEIFRRIQNKVWAAATIRKIKAEGSVIALIADTRFPNESDGVIDAGGAVIRLTKRVVKEGVKEHESEIALDEDRYDWNKFTAILDNREMGIGEQNFALKELLDSWGFYSPTDNK